MYANRSLSFGQGSHFSSGLLKSSEILVGLYKSTNNNDSVLKYLNLIISLKDSLYNQEKERLKVFTNITYNEEIKSKDADAAHIRSQNNLKYLLLLAGLLADIIITIILVLSNRSKQKANVILQHQKQRVESTLSELKSTQQQLIQSEKMASLGELTAGIAHEIQNPLNFVNNFSEVNKELLGELKEQLNKGNIEDSNTIANAIEANEEKINHHGKRADAIVKGMLQHSKSNIGVKEQTDINALCDEYLRLAYHGLRAKEKNFNVKLETDFDATIGKINIIPQDIGRVVLNLINNAFYAVNEKKKIRKDFQPIVTITTKKTGSDVLIKIKDNGNGISQNIVDKIFQPFFTTKPTGEGTGLGLSLSYDIIKSHGGEIKVETVDGEGTTFVVVLPISG